MPKVIGENATSKIRTRSMKQTTQLSMSFRGGDVEERARTLGAVYTPTFLADWVNIELSSYMRGGLKGTILDPACGDGALLESASRLSPGLRVAGIDVDRIAVGQARKRLKANATILCADALHSVVSEDTANKSWNDLVAPGRVSAVISNPPWGASLTSDPTHLRGLGYELAFGQYDSFDVFVEMSLKSAPSGAILAFILPDALFLPEHKALRGLLLDKTRLRLIARLGEGFFSGVYRGTAVVICEKIRATKNHRIQCFRLKPAVRKRVLAGTTTLQLAKADAVESVPQALFANDSEKRFVIDVKQTDLRHFASISQHRSDWASVLSSGRGVELSKHGNVLLCPDCGFARPTPRQEGKVLCLQCGKKFLAKDAKRDCIIKKSLPTGARGWQPLIVGEDVSRYRCQSSRMIRSNVCGVNYKTSALFKSRKLLVRKTGIGLNAAIDDSGALTNQVVFHYMPKGNDTPEFYLDYVLGVMCSRIMLAHHLVQSGESEWRSHPYVTQKVIAELPIPNPRQGTWQWRQAQCIASAVSQAAKGTGDELQVDRLVAGLFGLDRAGCSWALGVIDDAQSLQGIAPMRVEHSTISPVRIQ